MSRRAILSLAASAIIGIGVIGTISTDAFAYRAGVYRGGVYRGGVYRGGAYRGGYYRGVRPGVAVGIGCRCRRCFGRCRRRGCLLRPRLLRRPCPGRLSIRLLLLCPVQPLRTDAIIAAIRKAVARDR